MRLCPRHLRQLGFAIESKRFGYGIVGEGFVIRAVDNSNIVPLKDVNRLRQLTGAQKIQ